MEGVRRVGEGQRVQLSVGRTGKCWDCALAESFIATLKRELIETQAFSTRAGLHRALFECIEGWYNTRRLNWSLGYLNPAVFEALNCNVVHQVE